MNPVHYGVRETRRGYRLTQVETIPTFHGTRKYSNDIINMTYRRKDFAIKKAHAFYKDLYPEHSMFIGLIGEFEYTGELLKAGLS